MEDDLPHVRVNAIIGGLGLLGIAINVLREHVSDAENLVTSRVNTKDDIYDSIKAFFAKGR